MRTAAIGVVYASVLVFGLYQTFGPVLNSGFSRVQTERGDGMLNHYILEHTWQSITNPAYRGSMFSPPCFYPEPYTIWYSEHLLGVAPIYWGLRLAAPYDLAYQWWQIILEALNFVAFALIIRWLRGPHVLAILGGYIWAFSLIQIDQIKHQQMIPRFAMALAAYHAWALVVALGSTPANPKRHLNRMMAAVFWQGITCVNTGWFLVTGLATFLPLAILLRHGGWRDFLRFLWRERWPVAFIVGGWTAALFVTYVPYFVVNWGLGRDYKECLMLMPTVDAWLAGLPGTVWEPVVAPYRAKTIDECWLFCGFGIYALMLVAGIQVLGMGLRTRRSSDFALALAGLLTAALWVLFTLKVGSDRSLWEFIRLIPGGMAIRAVSRVYVTVYLFGVLASLIWLARVTEVLPKATRFAVLVIIAGAIIGEQLGYEPPSFEKGDFYPMASRAAEELKKADIGYVLPWYTDTQGVRKETVYGEVFGMWCGLLANVPVVNGYSGRHPDEAFIAVVQAPDIYREDLLRKWLKGKFRGKLALVNPDKPEATQILVID